MDQFELRPWSDPPHTDFCVRFFLDTNVLVSLVDNTFDTLCSFIEMLNITKFAELVSSHYVIFEFVGARKREHYLRTAAGRAPKAPGGQLNFSSLLRFRDDYKIPGTVFEDVISGIRDSVIAEVDSIANDYRINFDYGSFHQDQLQPTRDICLASKLANQDCLVLISSVLPEQNITHQNVLLLTNDKEFSKFFESADLATLLSSHSIFPPSIVFLRRVLCPGAQPLDLTDAIDDAALVQDVKKYLLAMIKIQLGKFYLGETFAPKGSAVPNDCVCFSLRDKTTLPLDIYVTILSKDLDFIYTTKTVISDFRHNGSQVNAASRFSERDNNISFRIVGIDETGKAKSIPQDIIDVLRAEGNLLFIHPDSLNS